MNKRTFIAIKVTPEKNLLDILSVLKSEFQFEQFKWVNVTNFHITLHFIGETTPAQIEAITEMLHLVTSKNQIFWITINGTGSFGSHSQPRVLFANVDKGEAFVHLFKEIADGLTALGLRGIAKTFSPHLTLARMKKIENQKHFYSTAVTFKNKLFQSVEVAEIVFYESVLLPSGPVYKPIQKFKLK